MTKTVTKTSQLKFAKNISSREALILQVIKKLEIDWPKGKLYFKKEEHNNIPFPFGEEDIIQCLVRLTPPEAKFIIKNSNLSTMSDFMAAILNYRQKQGYAGYIFKGVYIAE